MPTVRLAIFILRWGRDVRFRMVTEQIPERLENIDRRAISDGAGWGEDQVAQYLG